MRLFIAIELDDPVKEAIIRLQDSLRGHDRVVRWVTRDQMHLTLVFLGEVADSRVAAVADALKQAAAGAGPFDLAIGGSGCFPPRGGVRVIWVGVEEPTGTLLRCQSAVADAVAALGFAREERGFTPHLTLGRVRDDTTRGALRAAVETLAVPRLQQHVERVRLVQARLDRSGAQYATVAEYPLGA